MKKKRAILNFAGIIFVCLILVVLSFIRFTLPNSSNEYVGFLGAIDLGFEYKGGVKITLDAKNNSSDKVDFLKGLDAHALRINTVLSSAGYSTNVYSVGGKNIAIEVYNDTDIVGLLDLVSNVGNENLYIRTEQSTTADANFTQADLEECGVFSSSGYYYVLVRFNEAGKEKFKTLKTDQSSAKLYIYVGETLLVKDVSLSNTNMLGDDYFIVSPSNINNYSNANDVYAAASKILCTKYNFSFEQLSKTVVEKNVAQRNLLLSGIISAVLVIVCFVILIAKFKALGLVNALSLFIGLLIQIIMLQAVPVMKLTPSSLIASVMIFVLTFVLNYIYLSKIAHEYAQGKKINSSFKFGYQKSYMTMVEAFVATLVASIVFYIFGSSMVRYFAMALIIGSIIYGLCDLLVSYGFNKMCVNINGHNAKKYGFRREANVDELEEI